MILDLQNYQFLQILTLASLQGIADILSGEGIAFDELEMRFSKKII